MLLLASGGFGVVQMAERAENVGTGWTVAAQLFQHAGWVGMSAWDLIQPAFMFMVGVALPFSYAHRRQLGHGWPGMFAHAGGRALALVLLGVLIESAGAARTNWVFVNVLSQIGLGYLLVFLLWRTGPVFQTGCLAALLLGYGGLFYYHDYLELGVRAADLGLTQAPMLNGWFAPFSPHTNFAATFDRWFLNLFPRPEIWLMHPGGYQTLNFIPATATMLMGLMAGELLLSGDSPEVKFQKLLLAGVPCLVIGIFAGVTFCPIIKRLWTPSWTLFSGAFVIWVFAAFYGVIDVLGRRRWAWPLMIVGMNSLLMYLLAELGRPWIAQALARHGNPDWFGGAYGPVIQQCAVLGSLWLVCAYLYWRRIFFRI